MNPHVQVLCMSVASSDRRRLADPIAVYLHPAPTMAKEFRVFCPAIDQGCKYNTRCIKTVDAYDDAVMILKMHLMESAKHALTERQANDLMVLNSDYIKEVGEDGQLIEVPITPPPPAPTHAASSKAGPRARELMTSTPNVSSKRPRTEIDAHQLRVY